MRANQGTQVQIFGQVYRLRGDEDPARVRRVAKLVDEKMGRIADQGVSADSYRIAVLAALELADELLKLDERHSNLHTQVCERSYRLVELLDTVQPSESVMAATGAD